MTDAPPPSPTSVEGDPTWSLGKDVTVTIDYVETVRVTFSKDEGLISNSPSSTP